MTHDGRLNAHALLEGSPHTCGSVHAVWTWQVASRQAASVLHTSSFSAALHTFAAQLQRYTGRTLTVSVVASLSPVPRHERMQRRQNACSHASSPNLRALGGCWPMTTSRQMPHCRSERFTTQRHKLWSDNNSSCRGMHAGVGSHTTQASQIAGAQPTCISVLQYTRCLGAGAHKAGDCAAWRLHLDFVGGTAGGDALVARAALLQVLRALLLVLGVQHKLAAHLQREHARQYPETARS